MMDKLGIPMPEAGMATTVEEALAIAGKIGYPVMVRPSYVLGGRGMEVVYDDESMAGYMNAAVGVTPDRPILIDRFLNHALECGGRRHQRWHTCFVQPSWSTLNLRASTPATLLALSRRCTSQRRT